jgi:3'-5' exoribonuclease
MSMIRDLVEEAPVNGEYLVLELQQKTAKNGSSYLAMRIGDKTGEIPMKIWEYRNGSIHGLSPGRVIRISGAALRSFNGSLQIEADGKGLSLIRVLDEAEVNYEAFLPSVPGNIEELQNVLEDAICSVENPSLRRLLEEFFNDNEFKVLFMRTPAALKRHHVYLGGLLDHTVGVLKLCLAAADSYPLVDRDLLVSGALLHDIGKVRTYQVTKGFEGTDEGRLIGHLVLGTQMVRDKIQMMREAGDGFSESVEALLLHLLVSHHGIMEWGSPVEPLSLEACILHHADNFDAQVNKFLGVLRENEGTTESWSPYNTNLGRYVYLTKAGQ